jgi:hypothetical protein
VVFPFFSLDGRSEMRVRLLLCAPSPNLSLDGERNGILRIGLEEYSFFHEGKIRLRNLVIYQG